MLLHTPAYLIFLLAVVLIYWLLPAVVRKPLLLVTSYIFYAWFNLRFLTLLLGLTLANYLIGLAIHANRRPRLLAWSSVAINLGVLAVFKWSGFFVDSLRAVFEAIGLANLPPGLSLLLPLGISFYSFQAIAYTTEIYRKKTTPADLLDFALYLAFFPKLIAGPLVRPGQFLRQLRQPAVRPATEEVQAALGLLLIGLVKKVVIADSLASLSDVAFRAAARPPGEVAFPSLLFWQGFYLYSFLIYADFSGYTDIARASARLLGFGLPENFQQPYLSRTITLFWNRWHMSLTQWFREYLFFPLSRTLLGRFGSRYSRTIQVLVTLVTMILIGVWHGAAWTFVVWGVWHGLLLVFDQQANLHSDRRWQTAAAGIITFHLVGIGWVIFGSSSLAAAGRFLQGMFNFSQPIGWQTFVPPVLLAALLSFGIDLGQSGRLRLPAPVRPVLFVSGVVVVVCLVMLSLAHGVNARPFIYGRF